MPPPRAFALTSLAGKRTIVGLAIVQALLLLLFHEGLVREWTLFGSMTVRTVYLTLTVAGPATLHLLLYDPGEARPWWFALGVIVLLLPLAWHAGAQCAPGLGVESEPILVPFGASVFVAWFAGLAFLQAGRRKQWFDYALLWEAIWHDGLSLLLAGLFTGAVWVLLGLCMALFDVIGLSFVEELFTDRRFAYPATGLIAGTGLVLVRSYEGATEAVRGVLLALVKALLPLAALITLVFLIALPLTGLQPLWDTGHAAFLMMVLAAAMIVLLNGVFETGPLEPPYPILVRRVVEAAFLALPTYPVLSAYALVLRVGQYGWTLQRVWAALVILVLGIAALCYAASVLWTHLVSRREEMGARWMGLLRPVNISLGLGLVGVALLASSPMLDPTRIVVADQVERITGSNAPASELEDDLAYLRFEVGERGYRALRRLRASGALAGTPDLSDLLDTVLASERRAALRPGEPRPPRLDAEQVREAVPTTGADTTAVPAALYGELARSPAARACRSDADCVLTHAQLRDGGPEEWALFVREEERLRTYLWAYGSDQRWAEVARLRTLEGSGADSAWAAVRRGDVATAPSAWRELVLGDVSLGPWSRSPSESER